MEVEVEVEREYVTLADAPGPGTKTLLQSLFQFSVALLCALFPQVEMIKELKIGSKMHLNKAAAAL